MNQSILNSDYKKEIDGLRALAVIGVVINHINYKILQSGYLGVDIFFVISGFVITSSLSRNTKSKNFLDFLMQFYSKRIKRILPALTIYVILVSILKNRLLILKNELLFF